MKYTWDSVIIDPTSDKAKNAIGKEVYYANNPVECMKGANAGGCSYKVLQSLDLLNVCSIHGANKALTICRKWEAL